MRSRPLRRLRRQTAPPGVASRTGVCRQPVAFEKRLFQKITGRSAGDAFFTNSEQPVISHTFAGGDDSASAICSKSGTRRALHQRYLFINVLKSPRNSSTVAAVWPDICTRPRVKQRRLFSGTSGLNAGKPGGVFPSRAVVSGPPPARGGRETGGGRRRQPGRPGPGGCGGAPAWRVGRGGRGGGNRRRRGGCRGLRG